MSTYRDEWLSTDTADDADTAFNEEVSEKMAELEKDPSEVMAAMGEYEPEDYDLLEKLEAEAHMTGEWAKHNHERMCCQARAMKSRAVRAVAEDYMQKANSASDFASMLTRGH